MNDLTHEAALVSRCAWHPPPRNQCSACVTSEGKGSYSLGVGAVPVDAVSLRRYQPGANADDEARNPKQIHVRWGGGGGKAGGGGSARLRYDVRKSHALSRRRRRRLSPPASPFKIK